MAPHSYFVTGTDTGVGKTLVSCALLEAAKQQGLRTLGVKPVAAGCAIGSDGPRNEDAQLLRASMTLKLDYELVNPYPLVSAVAPHIAAKQQGLELDVAVLELHCRGLVRYGADFMLIEGAGGWLLPLNADELYPQLVQRLGIPVILVVAMRLGCLNHALLTCAAIQCAGVPLAGWVANLAEEMPEYEENLLYLKEKIAAPCLGEVPRLARPDPLIAAAKLEISPLLA